MTDQVTVSPGGPLRGRLRVPGDKSVSHRALLLTARANGTSLVTGLSGGDDVLRTADAMRAMGATVAAASGDAVEVTGGTDRLGEPQDAIDLGNSGTGARLLAGWCAGRPWATVLRGDVSLHKRPMGRVVDPLRRMGAFVDGRSDAARLPLLVRGGNLTGIEYTPPVASAQLKSAVLLAGLDAAGPTVVHEPVPTRAHTEEMLETFGVDLTVDEHADGSTTTTLHPKPELEARDVDVPGDPSAAAFWLVAAAVVPGSDVTVEHVYVGPGRAGLIDVLVRMGADVDIAHHTSTVADLRVRHSALRGTEIEGAEVASLIDELPILAVAAALADGVTTVVDAAELRVKESDRIAAIASEIGGLGVEVDEQPDGFVVRGRPGSALVPKHDAIVRSHLDHRIAMTGAIAALVADRSVTIEGWSAVATSYPGFLEDLATLRSENAKSDRATSGPRGYQANQGEA